MRIVEILLPKNVSDRSLSPQQEQQIDMLQSRIDRYVDKIFDPSTTPAGREFLKARVRDDMDELKNVIPRTHKIAEAVHKLPLTLKDFDLTKKVMERPIPAAVASIFIQDIIEDDELSSELDILAESEPDRDIRPLIVNWFERVMPDQMYHFVGSDDSEQRQRGLLSPIHGYDPKMYKGTNDPITGDAFGRYN